MSLSITFNFGLDDENGNPEDPAYLQLANYIAPPGVATWGVRRVSNGAILVPALTPTWIVPDSVGRYHVTLTDGVDGITLVEGASYEISWKYAPLGGPPSVYNYLEEVKAAGTPANAPVEAAIIRPYYKTRDLPPVAQGSEHEVIWQITDVFGAPVDLSGKTLRLVAYLLSEGRDQYSIYDDEAIGTFAYDDGDGLEVSGDDSNIITLTHREENTSVPGDFRYMLWNVTDKLVLVKGRMPIEPSIPVEI